MNLLSDIEVNGRDGGVNYAENVSLCRKSNASNMAGQ